MTRLLALGDPTRPPDPGALDAPDGFAWWYFDLLTADHQLLVVICSFGLPFLPGSPSGPARDKPSLNVALYQGDTPRFFLLQEYESAAGTADGERIALGASTLTSEVAAGRRRVSLQIDATLPGGGRLVLTAALEGPVPRLPDPGPAAAGDHRWTPLTAGAATAVAEVDGRRIATLRGRGYHDRNVSLLPLPALGCAAWWWARVPTPDGERIAYVLWPEQGPPQALAVTLHPDGSAAVAEVEASTSGRRWGRWGLPFARDVALRGSDWRWRVHNRTVVEDSPFYLRFLVSAEDGDGVGEWVAPGRLTARWHAPLVGMAVHRPHGRSSLFVGLFSGEWPGRARPWRWLR